MWRKMNWEVGIAICITLMACLTRLSMALGQIFYVLSIVLIAIYWYRNRNTWQAPSFLKPYIVAYGIMLLCLFPSAAFTGHPLIGIPEFINVWLWRIPVFLVVIIALRNESVIYKMLATFFVVFGIDCLVAFMQPLLHVSGVVDNRGWGFGSSVLTLSGIMVMLAPTFIVMGLDNRYPQFLKNSATFAFVSLLLGMYGNKSRSAWLINFITMPTVALTYIKKTRKVWLVLSIVSIAIGCFALQSSNVQRISSLSNFTTNGSNLGRLYVGTSAVQMFKDHPVIGVGIGQWRTVYEQSYRLPEETQHLYHAHNNFLQLLSEVGILGTVGVVGFFLYLLYDIAKRWHSTKNPAYICAFLAIVGYIFLFGQAEYTLDNSSGMRICWYIVGLLMLLGEKDYKKSIDKIS